MILQEGPWPRGRCTVLFAAKAPPTDGAGACCRRDLGREALLCSAVAVWFVAAKAPPTVVRVLAVGGTLVAKLCFSRQWLFGFSRPRPLLQMGMVFGCLVCWLGFLVIY